MSDYISQTITVSSWFFIISGHFGHFRAAAFVLFPVVLAISGRLHLYYFRSFWPFPGGCICIISGRFGHFRAAAFLLFPAWRGGGVRGGGLPRRGALQGTPCRRPRW